MSVLQVDDASNYVIADQIKANLHKLIAKLQKQPVPALYGLCDQGNIDQAEAVVKAKRLSAAASLQPMG